MKLVHISDIHIHHEPILDHDPVDNFERCLAHVEAYHADADRIVITGDLTHRGQEASYRRLRDRLEVSPLQGERRPRLLIGNHDRRETFRAVFADTPVDPDGFIQSVEDVGDHRFVYLDSVLQGSDSGSICALRRAWLGDVLSQARQESKPVFLFMHHNPVAVHVANADVIGLVDEAEFRTLISPYRDIIRHVFFGHCHFTLSGVVDGIAFSAPRSTNHACWPDFSGIADRMGHGALSPNYNVCLFADGSTVIHSIDFLDEDKVLWRIDS